MHTVLWFGLRDRLSDSDSLAIDMQHAIAMFRTGETKAIKLGIQGLVSHLE